ncbi:7873_t:CDS:2 [Diversispora eburnea]|uniref:7873_t:CDS:1 n=1 Tax=Diversispora eburnea TaxID=1213867 RepID=A0A9N9GR14_9GLOM|nr:7873_t:CDS:2 [Diversispora eburnea]
MFIDYLGHKITREAIRQQLRYSSKNVKINNYSKRITQPKSQGAFQAICDIRKRVEPEDTGKALIGIAINERVVEAGMIGYRFNTVGVSDGVSIGTREMCFSLQSRDLIADSIETVMGGQRYDAFQKYSWMLDGNGTS